MVDQTATLRELSRKVMMVLVFVSGMVHLLGLSAPWWEGTFGEKWNLAPPGATLDQKRLLAGAGEVFGASLLMTEWTRPLGYGLIAIMVGKGARINQEIGVLPFAGTALAAGIALYLLGYEMFGPMADAVPKVATD